MSAKQPALNRDSGQIPYHQVYFGCCNRTVMTREDVAQPKYCPFCGKALERGMLGGLRALNELAARYAAKGYATPQMLTALIAELESDERCNFYFGGLDGGNRCQRKRGHHENEEEGHEWEAKKENDL